MLTICNLLPTLEWLSQWYANECDEYWEHLYGVNGSMTADGSCHLQIDLDETIWEGIAFQDNQLPQLTCQKEGSKFIIDCQFSLLNEGLIAFREWVESHTK